MSCPYQDFCGGCTLRHLTPEEYQTHKLSEVKKILSGLSSQTYSFSEPIFVADGQRRRASMAFKYGKGKLILGFNQKQSSELTDIEHCLLLTPKLNANLANIKEMLTELCRVKIPLYRKNKQIGSTGLTAGDVWMTEADNGIDIVLEFKEDINLECRLLIGEYGQKYNDIIRISHRRDSLSAAETILEKAKPYVNIAGYAVYIPAGTFLQACQSAEKAMIAKVTSYVGENGGNIADLFCGVGTFSYPLSKNGRNKITAIDSSPMLLEGFRQSVNKNMIKNIKIAEKNLFKYPLDEKELATFDIVVFDPPRAGALAQVQKIIAADKQLLSELNL